MPNGIICERFKAPNVAEATFVAAMAAYIEEEGHEEESPFLSAELDEWWGARSPDYRRGGLGESEVRAQHRFDWTVLYAYHVVLTWE